jgi:hypothetical protein
MAIIPLAPDNFEVFTLELHPRKQFSSGSLGITGSVNLFSERSTTQKLLESSDASVQTTDQGWSENKLVIELNGIVEETALSNNIEVGLESYMAQVNALPAPSRLSKTFDITRERPAETYAEIVTGSIKKQQIKNVLFPNYRSKYAGYNYAYTNYHTLNFFTASDIPINSTILYPNSSSVASSTGRISGSYVPENKFTFEFFINPRYTTDEPHGNFKAGTVMHMSSTYAVSMVTGSSKDINGYPDGFKLVLQLSHSADINPSAAIPGAYPNNLIFSSSDNSLKRNHWHHVAIRWGGNTINDGSGSFVIDGQQKGVFCVPSSSITPLSYDMSSAGNGNPSFLSIGNYYEGTNIGSEAQSLFFSSRVSDSDGLLELSSNTTVFQPNSRFNYPLNAEVHDLKIYSSYQTIDQIVTASKNGINDLSNVLFYVPPFFTKESTRRDVLITPLTSSKGTTVDPFNTSLSFRNSGRDINLENFVRDFKTGNYPRLLNLTGSSAITFPLGSTFRANDILYTTLAGLSTRQGHTRKRNLTILPNDNGKFRPNFNLLKTGSVATVPKSGSLLDKYTNDLGVLDLSLISLRDMLHSSALGQPQTTAKSSKGVYQLYGPGLGSGSVTLAGGVADMQSQPVNHPVHSLFQLTGNSDSNEIVVFNISNTFFGNNIREGSFAVEDTALKYSGDKVKIKLKDNGLGSLYRANSLTEHPTWSSVGNILYDEGVVVIKAPELSFFGEDGFSTQFSGSQNLHILRVYTPAAAGLINSSSNLSYIPVSSSLNPSDPNQEFVQITGINFHDDNLNVIMKASFAQPILKRDIDSFITKIRFDF